jgi:predicted Rossmann fold flavoprotein
MINIDWIIGAHMVYDVIVVGLGPAGMMACNVFEKNKINYLALEKNEMPGKKLLLTGGKRCNVTNHFSVSEFINALSIKHRKFLYPTLTQFGPKEIILFFESKGLKLVLEDYKYFPISNQSKSVLNALLNDLDEKHISYKENVVEIKKIDHLFHINTKTNQYTSKHLILSVGSNSYPSTGSSGDGLVFAKQLSHAFKAYTPAETHVYSSEVKSKYLDLQGVSIETSHLRISGSKTKYQGGLIFTHFGLSGPAIYHASEEIYDYTLKGETHVFFSLTSKSKHEVLLLLDQAKTNNQDLLAFLEQLTTKKLARKILEITEIKSMKMKEISNQKIELLLNTILDFKIKIDSVEAKEKAYVNQGGLLIDEIKPISMESKIVSQLHFAGEMMDLHGPIGGFNITIALSTGYSAAHHIVSSIKNDTIHLKGRKNEK